MDEPLAKRVEEARLTSLLGGRGVVGCTPTIGTVEPVFEKAAEPLEWETVGDSGRGLPSGLELCDPDMAERRFIHEGRDLRVNRGPKSAGTPSLPGVMLRSWSLRRCAGASPVVCLRILPDTVRPS
jgi:hypothetical protein